MIEPTVLDVYCGMGGWSIGFHREGFRCVGLDIVDVGYPYELIQKDIHDFHPNPELLVRPKGVVMSPPCIEFSTFTRISAKKGQRLPPDPSGPKGIGLVKEAIRVRDEAQPDFWVLENVLGSIPWIEPLLGKPMLIARPWVLWGNLPPFMLDLEPTKEILQKRKESEIKDGIKYWRLAEDWPFDPLSSWKRARIPTFIAQRIARQMKRAASFPIPKKNDQGSQKA